MCAVAQFGSDIMKIIISYNEIEIDSHNDFDGIQMSNTPTSGTYPDMIILKYINAQIKLRLYLLRFHPRIKCCT